MTFICSYGLSYRKKIMYWEEKRFYKEKGNHQKRAGIFAGSGTHGNWFTDGKGDLGRSGRERGIAAI